jgi:beta-lactamase class A
MPAEISAYYQNLQTGHSWGWKADDDFPAASVIKVPILLAVLREHQRAGVLFELHDGVEVTVSDLCRLMIVVSDNVASNLLLEALPEGALESLFQDLAMNQTVLGRRFMENARPGHDNRTTAQDMGLCLAALHRGEVLDRSHTAQALATMRRQQFREKIPLLLPPELSVAHKTGELDGVRHDVAMVEVPDNPYVLCLLTQKGGPSWEVDRALADLSLAVYHSHCGDDPVS